MNKLAYGIAFLFTFLIVTGVLLHLNNYYVNVWAMDFTAEASDHKDIDMATNVQNLDYSKIEKMIKKELNAGLVDTLRNFSSTARVDTVYTKYVMDGKLLDSMQTLQKEIAVSIKKNQELVEKKTALSDKELQDQNAEYLEWIKKTAKLYEAMDSGKAAKIITKYSDSVARDILYKMKQRKAAEVLAALNPEVANRITRVEQ
ncbi:MAG: hypothetical protein KKA84_14885 [Bacteroidetes bacterium]|nr:hypothetical protein [Bacteroidota bacterium]